MSEESSGRKSRRGRRRFFRPKKEGGQPAQPAQQQNRPQEGKQGSGQGRQRKARRRSKSRQRGDDQRSQQLATEADVEYVTPANVFIYTHSAHPEMRDSYEFRPDHFSNVGRRLDDYQINLTSLFLTEGAGPDDLPVMKTLPKPEFNWSDWEEDQPKEELKEEPKEEQG